MSVPRFDLKHEGGIWTAVPRRFALQDTLDVHTCANGSCLSENFYYQGSGKALPARLYGEFTEAIPPATMVQEAHQCGSLLQSRRDSMELCTLMGLKRLSLIHISEPTRRTPI
eukprot:2522451-Pleurochrysis_carterae.AAC.4